MFDYTGMAVKISGKELGYVKMDRCLLRVSLLSPRHFSALVEDLPRILGFKNRGINIGENNINSLLYVNEIVFIEELIVVTEVS